MDLSKENVRQAILAGNRSLAHLKSAKHLLDSARGLGIADILGGALFISLAKRKKMQEASFEIEEANDDLNSLMLAVGELNLVNLPSKISTGFLDKSDFLLDNIVSDIMVQNKINQQRELVNDTIVKVVEIIDILKQY